MSKEKPNSNPNTLFLTVYDLIERVREHRAWFSMTRSVFEKRALDITNKDDVGSTPNIDRRDQQIRSHSASSKSALFERVL